MMKNSHLYSAKGNVFTVLLAAVGLAGLLGTATYNLMSGPVASISRSSAKGITDADLLAAARITIMQAANQGDGGDCDGDGVLEPAEFTTATRAPTGGGVIDSALGAPATDAWGTPIGYCVWDLGSATDAAGCGGPSANRLDGTDNPLSGDTVSQTFMAFVSAGPDRRFGTTCQAYVDGSTALVSTGTSDDIALVYSYAMAAQVSPSIWKLKAGDVATATLETGIDAQVGGNINFDASAGAGSFTAVSAQGLLDAGYGAIVGSVGDGECADASDAGLIRFSADTGGGSAGIEFCDGADWVAAGAGVSGGDVEPTAGGLWTQDGDNIYYEDGAVIVGDDTDSDSAILKMDGANAAMAVRNMSSCGASCGGTLNLARAKGTAASPAAITTADKLGSLRWKGYGTQYNTAARIVATAQGDPLASGIPTDFAFEMQGSDGTTRTPVTIKSNGNVGIGTSSPSAHMHILQDMQTQITTPAIVRTQTLQTGSNITSTNANWPATPTAGNVLIVTAACWRSASNCTLSISDNQAGTGSWSTADNSAAGRTRAYIFYKVVSGTPSGTFTITLTSNNSATYIQWGGWEVSGISTSTPLDKKNGNTGTTGSYTGTNQSASTTGGATATPAFAVAVVSRRTNDTNINFAPASGWTQDQVQQNGTAAGIGFSSVRQTTSTSGNPLTHIWSNDAGVSGGGYTLSGSYSIATFNSASGLAGSSSPNYVALGTHADSASTPSIVRLESSSSGSALSNSDTAGTIDFIGYDGDSYETVGRIAATVNTTSGGAVSSTNMPLDLTFSTGQTTATLTERMRIDSRGYVGINRTPQTRLDIDGVFLATRNNTSADTISMTGTGKRIIVDTANARFIAGNLTSGTAWNAGNLPDGANFIFGTDIDPENGISIGKNHIGTQGIYIGTGTNSDEQDTGDIAVGNRLVSYGPTNAFGNDIYGHARLSVAIGNNIETGYVDDNWLSTFIGNNIYRDYFTASAAYSFMVGLNASNSPSDAGDAANRFIVFDGKWGVGTVTPTHILDVVGTAGDDDSTTWTNASDLRLKTVRGPYQKGLTDIRKLEPVRYHYKTNNAMGYDAAPEHVSFIAQDVQPIFPESITQNEKGFLEIDLHPVSVALINALQDLDDGNKALRLSNDNLRVENDALAQKIDLIEEKIATLEKTEYFQTATQALRPALLPILLVAPIALGLLAGRRTGRKKTKGGSQR